MKTPFKLKFNKEVEDTSTAIIIDNFKKKFLKSSCDKIYMVRGNKIRVENNFIRFNFGWDIWSSIGTAELVVTENQNIKAVSYSVDYTRLVIYYLLALCFFLVMIFIQISNRQTLSMLIVIVLGAGFCLNLGYIYAVHRNLFRKVIKHGVPDGLGKYDWSKILSKKTDQELLGYIRNERGLPVKISEMAREELIRRNAT